MSVSDSGINHAVNNNNNNNKVAKEQYIKRHDKVCAQLHFNIRKETGVQLDKKHWYERVPKSVETSQGDRHYNP